MASKIRVDNITNLNAGSGSVDVEVGIDISGDINSTGSPRNGAPFAFLPEQGPGAVGSMLISDGQTAFWASPTNGAGVSNPSGTDDMPAGNGRTGGVNLQNPSVLVGGYLPTSGQAQWFDNTGATPSTAANWFRI